MQLKALLLAPLVAAGLVMAAPEAKPNTFEVMALRSASPIHFAPMSASRGFLYLNLPKQNATCEAKSDNSVTFNLVNNELYLYRKKGTRQQKVWVDRSGMGQGVLGYTTGDQSAPKNSERKGWKIDKSGTLTFNGAGLIACPKSIKGSWSVWVNAGVNQPGGNKGCLPFNPRTIKISKPNSCLYTYTK